MLFQAGLLTVEIAAVSMLLAGLFHLRGRFGLSPLYIALGSFQYLQVVLALGIYVEILPGIAISPGSSVLFMSTLFAVLLVYLREDAAETRSLIVGLVISNIALAVLSSLFSLHASSTQLVGSVALPDNLFDRDWRLLVVGTGAWVIDAFLVVVVYESIARWQSRFLWPRLFTTLSIVAIFDSVVFVTGSFIELPNYRTLLLSSIVGKVLAGFLFSLALAGYMRFVARDRRAAVVHRDVFTVLSYRERYERLKKEVVRDALTGLFNRRFFDEEISLALSRAERSGNPLCLLILDVDGLKQINDQHGHPIGDEALKRVGEVLGKAVRAADVPCRLGGDEFAIISPDASRENGIALGERLQSRLRAGDGADRVPTTIQPRLSIGVAEYPTDGDTADELYSKADQRLYLAKEHPNGVVGDGVASPARTR